MAIGGQLKPAEMTAKCGQDVMAWGIPFVPDVTRWWNPSASK